MTSNKRMKAGFVQMIFCIFFCSLCSCSSSKFVPEGEYLLGKTIIDCDACDFDKSRLLPYTKQKENTKWAETLEYKLKRKLITKSDSVKYADKIYKKYGTKPLFFDENQAQKTCLRLQSFMRNEGYLGALVGYNTIARRRKKDIIYKVKAGDLYFVNNVEYNIADHAIESLLLSNNILEKGLKAGKPFSVDHLETERQRITSYLRNNGYYKFNKEFIHYQCDTMSGSRMIDVVLLLEQYQANEDEEPKPHTRYRMKDIVYSQTSTSASRLRRSVIENNMMLKTGEWFDANKLQQTFNNYSRLQSVKYTNIKIEESTDSACLNAHVDIRTNKPSTISFQPEGTNTAGNLGAAATLSYENKNLFKGSETLSLQLRAAFEAITGLEGYNNKNYEEYGVESKLTFPRLLAPFVSAKNKIHVNATSELALSYNLQNRPEFHRRVFSSVWRYRWKASDKALSYRLDLIDLNYIYMPWISATFKSQYLDNATSRNAILRYNYEDLFITKIGFSVYGARKRHGWRASIETSGNLLNAASAMFGTKRNANGQYTLFNIAFAQYVKGDFDYTYAMPFSPRSSLVAHANIGIAYPYGNSSVLPFEKRYFSGGANSVRGWNVRGLGPGSYHKQNGDIDFINQTGDVKLDLNIEYRFHIVWKIDGAAFVDAGNVWTIREYAEQPLGKFIFSDFYRQIAFAYGCGVRLNFDYFILRFDAGMKAVNPAYSNSHEHYPVVHPRLSRDFAFHFAVGLPF